MSPLSSTMIILGVVCILAAIVGGGMTALGYTMPVIQSRARQGVLALFGLVIIVVVALNHHSANPFKVDAVTVAWDDYAPSYPPSFTGCNVDETYTARVTTE